MPKFHLQIMPLVNANNDYHIELDGIPYNEHESYSQVNSIFFSNKYGSVLIKGYFDLSNKNIPSLIIINKLSLELSKQLLKTMIYNFCKYKQEIEFNFTYDDIKLIQNIEQLLIKEYNCSIDYNRRKIMLKMDEIKNINILNKIERNVEDDDQSIDSYYLNILKSRQKIKNIDENNIQFQINKINTNINNENVQNQIINDENIIDDSLNNVEMEDYQKYVNPFISEKAEEKKIETVSDLNVNANVGMEMDIGIRNNNKNYIKTKDIAEINKFGYNKEGNFMNEIKNPNIKNRLKKLISSGASLMKKNIKTNMLNSLNINGLYLLLNKNLDKNGNNYSFIVKKLSLNKEISNNNNDKDLSDYKRLIFNNYIDIFDNIVKNKKSNIDINDYTHIILTYINQIQNKIDEMEKNQNQNFIGNNNNIIIEKYKKIISTLKLFCILFLNCFIYKPENQYVNDANLFSNSFSDKVMSYRKRLLIEWCVDEQRSKLEKNMSKINLNNENNIKLNYEKLYSYGQIKKNIDNNTNDNNSKKMSLFMRAKMANNVEKISKNNMYYFTGYNALHNEKNRQFRDIFIDKYNNDWISFLVQSLLYEEKRQEYIVYSIELLSKHINTMNNSAKPTITVNNSTVYDIQFILLKLYEQYLKGNINEQIKYLKMLSYSCNITQDNSSDHFIHYIICSTLLKILPVIFPKYDGINHEITDKIFIKKITYNLLIQTFEELLINSSDINDANSDHNLIYENYIYAIKLISLSFLNKKIKNKLIDDLINKMNVFSDSNSLNYMEENNDLLLTEHQKYLLLGYINNSLCSWKNAYNNFISAKEYKYALDACINYGMEQIKQFRESTDFKEIFLRLNEIKKNMPILFVDIYQIIFLFIQYMSENKNNSFGIDDVIYLLEEFSSKEKYLCQDLIDDDTKGIIIDLLYKLLIKINKEKIATGNCELIEKKYVKTNTMMNMMNNTFMDNIKFKNNIFC